MVVAMFLCVCVCGVSAGYSYDGIGGCGYDGIGGFGHDCVGGCG